MIARTRFSILLTAALSLLLAACHTAQRYTESGDYDSAIDFCVQKLRGKPKKKTEYVQGLEGAFQKAQARDLRLAENLADVNHPENWDKVNRLHRRIQERQEKVRPLMPLMSKDGYRAHFDFVAVEAMERDSREKAAEYLYTRAEDLLRQADQGDRQAAREAYQAFTDLEARYFRHYKETDRLKQDARALGTTHILFEIRNQSDQVLPRAFYDQVLAIGTRDLDSEWKAFHLKADPDIPVDYRVVFNIRRVDVSPERISERAYVDEKEIEDGWEYVLDERGNVKKDTAGNDIKRSRFVRIRAHVLEAFQSKAVRIAGVLEVLEPGRDSRLDSRDLATEVLFEHYASTFTGDPRALSAQSRRCVDSRPVPFPYTEDMLVQAADRLKPDIREELRRNRAIL